MFNYGFRVRNSKLTAIIIAVLLFAAAGISGGCAKKHPVRPEVYYWYITQTDVSGNVLSNDPEDWQDSGILSGVKIYPNPLEKGQDLTIDFTLSSAVADINIDFFIGPDDKRLWYEYNGAFSAGANQIVLQGSTMDNLEPGKTYRVYLSTGASQVWGDLRIK